MFVAFLVAVFGAPVSGLVLLNFGLQEQNVGKIAMGSGFIGLGFIVFALPFCEGIRDVWARKDTMVMT